MKSVLRLVFFAVFASAFCYLLWFRLTNPTDEIRVAESDRSFVPGADDTLDQTLRLLSSTSYPFAREAEAENYFRQRVQHYLKYGNYVELEAIIRRIKDDGLRTPNDNDMSGLFYRSLNSTRASWQNYLKYFYNWTNQFPNSQAAHIGLADAHINHAWGARGSGWASDVRAENWRLFKIRLNNAREVIKQAEKLPGEEVHLHAMKIKIARADGDIHQEGMAAFKEAVAIDPMAMRPYAEMVDGLLPRWGGQPGEWIEFARTAGEKYMPRDAGSAFSRLVSYVSFNYASEEVQFQETDSFVKPIDWEELKESFQAGTNRCPRSTWVWSPYSVPAFRAEDPDTGAQIAQQLGAQFASYCIDNDWVADAYRNYASVRKSAPYIPRVGTLYLPPAAGIADMEFSPDGRHIVAGDRVGRIVRWDVNTLEVDQHIDSRGGEVANIAFSPDGSFLAATFADFYQKRLDHPPELRLYCTDTWKTNATRRLSDYPYGLAFDGTGKNVVVSGGGYQTKAFVDMLSIPSLSLRHFEWNYPTPVRHGAYIQSQNGVAGILYAHLQLFTNSSTPMYGFVVRDDTNNFECIKLPLSFQASNDERFIAIGRGPGWDDRSEPGWFALWEVHNWTNSTRLNGMITQGIEAIAWTPDDQWIFTGGYDQAITLWDRKEFKQRAVLLGHRNGITELRISPDGRHLLSGSYDGTMMLWDISALDRF